MKYHVLTILLLALGVLQLEAQVVTISPAEATVQLKKKRTVVLDVRTQQEYAEGHLPGAVNIDVLDSANFVKQIQTLKKRKQYVVYCRSGKRSLKASEILINNKFKHIYNMEGGIQSWKGTLQIKN
jgi:rhodanese-related sulfurtransferase